MVIILWVNKIFVNVVIDVGGSSKCFETIGINVNEVRGKGNGFLSKIGKEVEGSNRLM